MFAFDRSAFAVLAPLALLLAVVWVSARETRVGANSGARSGAEVARPDAGPAGPAQTIEGDQLTAANLPSR